MELENPIGLIVNASHCTVQEAIRKCWRILQDAKQAFDDAQKRLPTFEDDAKATSMVAQFVQGCKNLVVANSEWRSVSVEQG